jgi:hypothetical protein
MIAERVPAETVDTDASQMIEERVREAVQPILASFQQEVAQAVQLQVERVSRTGEPHVQPVPSAPGSAEPTQDEQTLQASEDFTPTIEDEQSGPARSETLRQALTSLAHTVEQQAEHRLPAVVAASLRALFSEAVRAAIRRQAEQALHASIARSFEALPESATSPELEQETEQALQAVLHEILDSAFGGSIGTELENHGQQALEALLRKDVEGAQEHMREALSSALGEVLAIVKRHRTDVIGIVIRVLTKASQQAVATKVQDGVEEITSSSVEGAKPKAHAAKQGPKGDREARQEQTLEDPKDHSKSAEEQQEDQGEDIRDQLASAAETLRQQLEEETKGLKQHLSGGLQSATKEGMRNQKFGRPPSGRSPSQGSNLGRPPSRRAPAGRPPSGRMRSR